MEGRLVIHHLVVQTAGMTEMMGTVILVAVMGHRIGNASETVENVGTGKQNNRDTGEELHPRPQLILVTGPEKTHACSHDGFARSRFGRSE